MKDDHLNEKDMFDIHFSDDENKRTHLATCERCGDEYEKFSDDMKVLSEDAFLKKVDSLDDGFFIRQKNDIMSALDGNRNKERPFTKLVPIAAFSMVLLLLLSVFIISRISVTDKNGSDIITMSEQDIKDDILLMEIEELKEMPGIEGLEIFVELNGEETMEVPEEQGAILKEGTKKA